MMTSLQRFFVISISVILALFALAFGWRYMLHPALNARRAGGRERASSPSPADMQAPAHDVRKTTAAPPSSPADTGAPETSSPEPARDTTKNMLKNPAFSRGLEEWSYWRAREDDRSRITPRTEATHGNVRSYVRIENPEKRLIGVQQVVTLTSGEVYRIRGTARSTVTNNSALLFGGRIGIYQPGVPEEEIVWMSESTQWWRKSHIFTNRKTGVATVYAHMGYGNIACTGEFTGIILEKYEAAQQDKQTGE